MHDCPTVRRWPGGPRAPHYRRAPGDVLAEGVLVRTATCIEGTVELVLKCPPQFDYGRASGAWDYEGDGYEAARIEAGGIAVRLAGSVQLELAGARAYGHTDADRGRRRLCGAVLGRRRRGHARGGV